MSDNSEDVLDERDTNVGANVFVKYNEFDQDISEASSSFQFERN